MKIALITIALIFFYLPFGSVYPLIKIADTCGIPNHFLKLQAIDLGKPYIANIEKDQTIVDPMIYLYLKNNKNDRVVVSIDYSYCLAKGLPYNRCRDNFMRIFHTKPISYAELEKSKGVIPVTCYPSLFM